MGDGSTVGNGHSGGEDKPGKGPASSGTDIQKQHPRSGRIGTDRTGMWRTVDGQRNPTLRSDKTTPTTLDTEPYPHRPSLTETTHRSGPSPPTSVDDTRSEVVSGGSGRRV